MNREFRYSITRICLRTGSLTLPQPMLELFPDEGSVEAVDLERDVRHELRVEPPRHVHGLGAFFREHDLHVNDQLSVRPLEDGRFALAAQPRPRRTREDEGAVRRALQALREGGGAMTEEELRAAHGLGEKAPLERALIQAPDLERRGGRWTRRAPYVREEREEAPPGGGRGSTGPEQGHSRQASDDRATARVTSRARLDPFPPEAGLNSARGDEDAAAGVDPDALARARQAFRRLGFAVDGLGGGRYALSAELGRGRYAALVQVLGRGDAPDWRRLLSQRRELQSDYLAVLGDVRDLHPLERQASGADASLWSWDGLERALQLSDTVMLGPVDLEAPFAGEGLHGAGMDRFEAGLTERIAARGAISDVLTRLSALRAPAVFLLDDLAEGHDLSREQLVRILDRLAEAPFQLVVHRGEGEYALRHPVSDALEHLAEYALSLRERLPDRTRARVRGEDRAPDEDPASAAAERTRSRGEPEPLGVEEIEAGLAGSGGDR